VRRFLSRLAWFTRSALAASGIRLDYIYDRYKTDDWTWSNWMYADDQMRGYRSYYPYYQNLGGTNNSWFSGAFANPSYKMEVVYLMATYKF